MSSTSLLSKATTLKNNSSFDIESDSMKLLEEINSGLNAPFEVFELLCKEMKFRYAALLMLDPKTNKYFPIIKKNFDRTSEIRLRMTEKALTKLIKEESKIQRYLSYNDCKAIDESKFINLGNETTKIYLLYTTSVEKSIKNIKNSFLLKNQELIRTKLLSFNKPIQNTSNKRVSPLFLIKANQFIKNKLSRNKSFYLFHINTKKTINKIISTEGLNAVNSYQIENMIYNIFENNIEHLGVVTRINFSNFLMILQLPKTVAPQLLTEHFNSSLQNTFKTQRKWQDLIINQSKYFETISTVGKAATLLLNQT